MEWEELLNIDDVILGNKPQAPLTKQFISGVYEDVMPVDLMIERVSQQSAIASSILKQLQDAYQITNAQLSKAASKIFFLLDQLGDSVDVIDDVLSFGNTTEESIVIDFSRKKDMRLTIYFNEKEGDEPDFEEAFLDYEFGGNYYLTNNTLYQIVEDVKELMK